MAELLRDDSATLNFSVGVLLVIGGKDTPEIQLKTAFIEIDGQPMMMMMSDWWNRSYAVSVSKIDKNCEKITQEIYSTKQ